MVRWSKTMQDGNPHLGQFIDEEELGKRKELVAMDTGCRAVTAPVSSQVQISSISFVRIRMQMY